MERLWPEKKNCQVFQLEIFVDNKTFNFHIFYKIKYFVTTQNATTRFLAISCVKLWSWTNENAMGKP